MMVADIPMLKEPEDRNSFTEFKELAALNADHGDREAMMKRFADAMNKLSVVDRIAVFAVMGLMIDIAMRPRPPEDQAQPAPSGTPS